MPVHKSPAILPEWEEFRKNLPKGMPYNDLMPTAINAEFQYDLEEIGIQGTPDGGTIVTFQVYIGRGGKLEPYKVMSHKVGPGAGPVSMAARVQIVPQLIWLFFNRTPDPVPAAPEQKIDVTGQQGDIKLPGEDPLPEGGEYVEDSAPIARRDKIMPALVDHLEPDGVPIFIDLDTVPEQFSAEAIIAQVLVEVDRAAVRFDSKEQVIALFTKNEAAIGFLKELGTVDDRKALADMLDKHTARLEAAAVPKEVRIPGGKGSVEAGPRRRRAST